MFSLHVRVECDEHPDSFTSTFFGGKGTTIQDIVDQARERSGKLQQNFQLVAPSQTLERAHYIKPILREDKDFDELDYVVVDREKGEKGDKVVGKDVEVYLVKESTKRTPLSHEVPRFARLLCLSYIPNSSLELKILPEIRYVSFVSQQNKSKQVVYEIPMPDRDNIKKDLKYPLFSSHCPTIQDILDVGLEVFGITLEDVIEGTSRLKLSAPTANHSIRISTEELEEQIIVQQRISDLELPGPIIYVERVPSIVVLAKCLTGRTHRFNFLANDIVQDVKERFASINGDRADQFRIISSGRQLENGKTLTESEIHHGSVLHVCMRLQGGMFHVSSARDDMDPMNAPFQRRPVTLHFANNVSRKLHVFDFDEIASVATEMTAVSKDRKRLRSDHVENSQETAEERVIRLRSELEQAEADLKSDDA